MFSESTTTEKPADAPMREALENDVCFILTSAFLIFTMQTGYGLLESGTVSRKNEVNILLKNAVNIACGSLAFWVYGFAFSSREADVTRLKLTELDAAHLSNIPPTKPPWRPSAGFNKNLQPKNNASSFGDFIRVHIVSPERFFVHVTGTELIGTTYAEMMFQLAYATTCTAIISGAMAERCRFFSYFVFSFFSNILFCLPARWTMFNGWLNELGVVDVGGSGNVHLVGGCAGLVAALMLGPRLGRFDGQFKHVPMGNPTNAVHGIIFLWWGWLGYSAGSTFGITGDRWKYASRASVTTIVASMAGGAFGMVWSAVTQGGLQDIKILCYSILASLVAISGGAAVMRPAYAIITGIVASAVTLVSIDLVERCRIDDPTDAFSVHAVAGAWGMLAIGLFADAESVVHYKQGFRTNITVSAADISVLRSSILLSQLYAIIVIVVWSLVMSTALLLPIYFTIGLRIPVQEEILGPDFVEHGIIHEGNKQLLNIIRQKIRFVSQDGMSEAQASAEVVARFAEQQKLRAARKVSLTLGGHRASISSLFSPPPGHSASVRALPHAFSPPNLSKPDSGAAGGAPQMWSRLREQITTERVSKHGRFYHNHERRRLSIKSILDAAKPGSIAGKPFRAKSTTVESPVWAVTAATSSGNSARNNAEAELASGSKRSAVMSAQMRYHRRLLLSQALEASERTKNSPGAYRSPPLPPIED